LIVSNDDVAADEMQRLLLPQAARGIPTSVLSVDATLDYCGSGDAAAERVFVIAKLPTDALALIEGGLAPEEINVGNQAPRPGTEFKMVTRSIAVTHDDAATYRAIADHGFTLRQRMMPSDRSADFLAVLAEKSL
jgi:PTS system mannose-specific IIB component